MSDTISEKLIEILRAELTGLDDSDLTHLSEKELATIYRQAKAHNLSSMVGDCMSRHGVFNNVILKDMAYAQNSVKNMDKAIKEITEILTASRIPFIPLKGIQLRKLYPKPWMRLSGDIDILIHEKDAIVVRDLLENKLGYTHKALNYEDHFITPNGTLVDVMTSLRVPDTLKKKGITLNNIWDYAVPDSKDTALHVLSDDMRYAHAVCHIARHLTHGGCGIAHIMDLWILNHAVQVDEEIINKRNLLLEKKQIKKAEIELVKISEKWFSNLSSETNSELEEYILAGAAHGTKNSKQESKIKKEGKLSYYLSRVFVPYEHLVILYPQLNGKQWLTPVFEVCRWLRQMKNGRTAAIIDEFSKIDTTKLESANRSAQMLNKLGL